MPAYTYSDIAKTLDHSLLRPELTEDQVREGCKIAREYDTASVCMRQCDLSIGREILSGSDVKLGTVIGFPLGYSTTAAKVAESAEAIENGARELDMVLNIGKLLSGDFGFVERDVAAVAETAHSGGAQVKVIFENCYLTDALIVEASKVCSRAGADWVKTSTGFGTGGATLEDVRLMREHSAANVQVKAAGGVRTLDSLLPFRELGCTRFGATATVVILDEVRKRLAG